MKPVVAAAVAAALLSGTAMYAFGAHTANVSAFSPEPFAASAAPPALQIAQYVPVQPGVPGSAAWTPASAPARTATAPAPVAAYDHPAPHRQRQEVRRNDTRRQDVRRDDRRREEIRDEESDRSWSKTALIIGGTAASGAGVGAVVNGKKGALIGAAIGGGAASIYEATRRR